MTAPRTFAEATELPERWALALALRAEGLDYAEIGQRLDVSKERAWQIVQKAERRARDLAARGSQHV